jgi:5-(carboxyamino)imidazole ribonucleotide synthase
MKVLIYGSGQLAKMMALAACPLGIQVLAVDVATQQVVDPISKSRQNQSLEQAITNADVLSVEFEHVPEVLLEQAQVSGKLLPSVDAILTGADRIREKQLLEKLNVPNCPYRIVTDVDQLPAAIDALGEQLIIKSSRDGYDGYGQWRLSEAAGLNDLQGSLSELDLTKVPLVVETMLSFDRELSLVGARSSDGHIHFYPLAENLHHQGQLHVSVAPAPAITKELSQQAQWAFTELANELDYVGVLAVEFFQVGEQLLVNEIAPRVHNSGHWSMQGSDTCQFENHIRAITGLPLGDTQPHHHSAMINIIGCDDISYDLLSIEGAHIHWYGKTVRQKRKMGHINLIADDYSALAESMTTLAKYLPVEHFPKLLGEADKLSKLNG